MSKIDESIEKCFNNHTMEKNILALDLGKGSLGMAISRSGMFVTPLENLRFKAMHFDECIDLMKEALEGETIEHIAMGYPLFPSGDPCEMTPIVESFIEMIRPLFPNATITKVDERNSTVEASALMHLSGKNAKKQRKNIDSAAATVILTRYLSMIGQD